MREKSLLFILFIVGAFLISSLTYAQDKKIKSNSNKNDNAKPHTVYGPALDNSASTLSESFEGAAFPPAGWIKQSPVGNIEHTWSRDTVGRRLPGWNPGFAVITGCPGGGTYVAGVSWGDIAPNNNEWLITPQITNVQANDSLSFWLRYLVPEYADSFSVKISTTTQTVGAMNTVVMAKRFLGNVDSNWVQYKFKLSNFVPVGSNIYIGFQEHITDNFNNGSGFTLDLVNVTASAPPPALSWFEQTTPVTGSLVSVSAANDNIVWACGYTSSTSGPPFVVRTTNGGTWTNNLGTGIPANVPLFNIWAIDANTALTTGSNSVGTFVYRTTNGGTNWTQVFTQAGGFINVINMTDANNGIIQGDPVGGRWSLWRTTNGGVNWDSTGRYLPQAGTEAGWNKSMYMNGNDIWFGTNNTRVYRSTNGGTSWTSQATTGEVNSYVVWFNSAVLGMAGGATMKMTDNGGGAWFNPPGTPLGTGNFTGITGMGSTWYYTRGGNTVTVSSNNGTNWSVAYTTTTGTFQHITKSRTPGSVLMWASKSNGTIAKYGVTTGITPINNGAVSDYKLSQNYPNPFNPVTKINFSLPKSGFVTLKVYDILGKEVATLVNEFKNNGTYAVDFNATNFASGVYLYKIEADEFVSTKRMMLVK